jgi:hypothetical protein
MSGKAATFGGRMMGSVADQVLKQFAANFASQSQALQAQLPVPVAAPATALAAGAAPPVPAPAAPVPMPAPVESQLNGLALAWAVFKDWLRSLFSAKRA